MGIRRFNGQRQAQERGSFPEIASRAAIFVGTAALAFVLLWFAGKSIHVLLMVFGGVLIAVTLHSLAHPLAQRVGLPMWAAVTSVVVLLFGGFALAGWWLAPSVSQQFGDLGVQLPRAIDRLHGHLEGFTWFDWLVARGEAATTGQKLFSQITRVFSVTFGAFAAIIIVIFLAIYMAAQPDLYVNGIVRLAPVSFRPRFREVLAALYRTLRVWLATKLITMIFTGVAIGVGLWLLDVPLALALAILAALLEFIPTIGPLLSAIPAILLAFVASPLTAAYVALLYFGVQWVGNHIGTPLLQQRTLALPPALSLVLVALLGALFGFPGLLLSGPLSVVVLVSVKMLYVEDVLERGRRKARPHHALAWACETSNDQESERR